MNRMHTDGDWPLLEPEFVGNGRRLLVDGLLAVFDEVNSSGTARWVSLEAPSGWGKTRVVREFYARLAAQRQPEPGYWPPTILGSLPERFDDVSARRKKVFPEVRHTPGSLPAFFWWGIAASLRNGVVADALAEDLKQVVNHKPFLDDAWEKIAPRSERFSGWWKQPVGEAAEEVSTHVAELALETLFGSVIPGIGLVRPAVEGVHRMRQQAAEQRARFAGDNVITAPSFDAVDETVAMLIRLARPNLPVVIFVEDFHAADEALSELLMRCAVSNSAILIITTSWPGFPDGTEHLKSSFAGARQRLIRLDHELKEFPLPFPSGSSLASLDEDARSAIMRFYYPRIDLETLKMLIDRYENPLAAELFCTMEKYRERFPDGDLLLSAREVAELPQTVEDLYRSIWKQLPVAVRRALTYASLGVPAAVDATEAEIDLSWHRPLVLDALATLNRPDSADVMAALSDTSYSTAWARELSHTLRSFHESTLWQIAFKDNDLLFTGDRDRFFEALAGILEKSLTEEEKNNSPGTEPDTLYRARLALNLHDKKLLSAELLTQALQTAYSSLESSLRELPALEKLLERAFSQLEVGSGPWCQVGGWYGAVLHDRGRMGAAIEVLEPVYEASLQRTGPSNRDTLMLRSQLADAYAASGQLGTAIELREQIHTALLREFGPDDGATLAAEAEVALAYAAAGQLAEAIVLLEKVDKHRHELFGADDTGSLTARSYLASVYAVAGRLDAAIIMHKNVLEERLKALDANHPTILTLQNSLSGVYRLAGRFDDAIELAEKVLEARLVTLPPDHPDTFASRNNVAVLYLAAGRTAEANELLATLANDYLKIFGPSDPKTLMAQNNLAGAYRSAGQYDAAVELFETVVIAREEALGLDHPDAMLARHNLAGAYEKADRLPAAINLYEQLIEDQQRVLEPNHPNTMSSRGQLAGAYESAGQLEAAIKLYELVLADRLEVLEPDHPDILATRKNLSFAYHEAGRSMESSHELEACIETYRRTRKPDDPGLLTVLWALGVVYEALGRTAESDEINAELEALERDLPEDSD